MPLDRASVTAASRIMLPTYAFFFGALGLNYLLTPRGRLMASPSLAYADKFMDLRGWGVLFLVAAALMVTALIARRRTLYRYALLLCVVAMSIWTGIIFLASFDSPASPAGWVYPGVVVMACLASERSLNKREVD